MRVYVCKLAWSSSGWKGLPENEDAYRKDCKKSGIGFVKKNGYAHEWWNFSEKLDDDHYIGAVRFSPTAVQIEEDSIVIFISYDISNGQMKFIGFYMGTNNLTDAEKEKILGKLPNNIPEYFRTNYNTSYRALINNKNIFDTKAPKSKSLILRNFFPIRTREAFGTRFGNVALQELNNKDKIQRAISWLEKNKEKIISQNEKIQSINEKLTELENALLDISGKSMLNILSAINTKPFIILSGISGTGKTQIARIVSSGIVKSNANNQGG